MTEAWDAVVAGHICLDIIPDFSSVGEVPLSALLRPGKLVEVGDATLSTGGAVANTGLALNILGVRTQLMGKVGDDALGRVVRDIISSRDPCLADGMVVDATVGTSYTVIISPPGVDRIFFHSPGANNTFGAGDVRYDIVEGVRLFHFGYPPVMRRTYQREGAELVEIFRRVRALGVTTSLDMALPDPASDGGHADWPAILRNVLPFVDVFLPSIEEILYMLRPATYRALLESAPEGDLLPAVTPALLSGVSAELLSLGAGIVGLKLGSRGFYLRTADELRLAGLGKASPVDPADWAQRELWSPCLRANLVGTTGAGDATIAGFLTGLLRGLPVKQAVKMAVAVGACNVEAADALGGLRSWDETQARLAQGWEHHDLVISAAGWRHDSGYGLWECAAVGR